MLARAASGDQGAFAQLYDRLSGPLYSLAARMLGDAAEAQDALQDVFLQIWRRAASYDAEQSSVFTRCSEDGSPLPVPIRACTFTTQTCHLSGVALRLNPHPGQAIRSALAVHEQSSS